MPSFDHEGLVDLFRNDPELAPFLLHSLGVPVPSHTCATLEDTNLSQTQSVENRADVVVVLRDGERPVHAVVVEVQLRPDDRKRFSWPVYVAALRSRLRCSVSNLVVTPDQRVADWAAEPIPLPCRREWVQHCKYS